MIPAHGNALIVFDTRLAAGRRILVGRILALPQIIDIKAVHVRDRAEVHDKVGWSTLGGLRGGGGSCGGVDGGSAAADVDGLGGGSAGDGVGGDVLGDGGSGAVVVVRVEG